MILTKQINRKNEKTLNRFQTNTQVPLGPTETDVFSAEYYLLQYSMSLTDIIVTIWAQVVESEASEKEPNLSKIRKNV